MQARYVHTNLVAKDWRNLAGFYINVFGCVLVPPERDYRGPEMDAGTGIPNVRLTGAHLRLPGHGETGPTLEIFNYEPMQDSPGTALNRPGFGHIAFEVDDVTNARREFVEHGGKPLGEVVTVTTKIGSRVTWCYMGDPEGNVVEIQSWEK